MSREIVLETKSWSVDTTPHNYPRENLNKKRAYYDAITKYKNKSSTFRILSLKTSGTRAIALKESPSKPRSSPSRLCSGTSITLMITESSHLCSHEQVDDHCKRKDHTTDHTTNNKRVS